MQKPCVNGKALSVFESRVVAGAEFFKRVLSIAKYQGKGDTFAVVSVDQVQTMKARHQRRVLVN